MTHLPPYSLAKYRLPSFVSYVTVRKLYPELIVLSCPSMRSNVIFTNLIHFIPCTHTQSSADAIDQVGLVSFCRGHQLYISQRPLAPQWPVYMPWLSALYSSRVHIVVFEMVH